MKFKLMNIKNIFRNQRLKAAFAAVKFDMDSIEAEQSALKASTNDWIMFLDHENRYLKSRVRELENRLDSMQHRMGSRRSSVQHEEEELSVLRTL